MAQKNTIGSIVKGVVTGGINKTLSRLAGAGISTDSRIINSRAKWSGRNDKKDWRVRLSIPTGADKLYDTLMGDNDLLAPLADARGIFWPLTPLMQIQHSANYNALAQTHSNYPFQAYQNSSVDSFNILGEFPVQNQQDARHWVATVNFLRTVTKMFFGADQSGLKGNPPPILHLSGYGDHMFNKVPVVVNSFNVELRQGIDYISTKQDSVYQSISRAPVQRADFDANSIDQSWAPTLSNISVLVTPVYSREELKNFSLRAFADGSLSRDRGIGFI